MDLISIRAWWFDFKTEENQKLRFPEAVQLWKEMEEQSTEASKKIDIRNKQFLES